jgi:hypothetical protein
LAEPWRYSYTDFGEGRGKSPHPVLRAVVEVSTPGATATFQAIVDTGGPITVVAADLIDSGGDPLETSTTMVLRLGGSTDEVPLYELTLEVRPPHAVKADRPIAWRGVVAVLDPWPLQGTAILLGQSGFLDTFTVTFGPDGFVLEPASAFRDRFPSLDQGRPDSR